MAEYNKTLDCVQAALIVVNRQPESHFVEVYVFRLPLG